MELQVSTNAEEVLRGKFSETVAKVNGYLTEADGDCEHNIIKYTPNAVRGRLRNIKAAFENDLKSVAAACKPVSDSLPNIVRFRERRAVYLPHLRDSVAGGTSCDLCYIYTAGGSYTAGPEGEKFTPPSVKITDGICEFCRKDLNIR